MVGRMAAMMSWVCDVIWGEELSVPTVDFCLWRCIHVEQVGAG